jgi:hypothetical protein
LREGGRLTLLENRVLRKTCLRKKDEVTGEWKRLYKEELYDLYSSLNIILGIKSRRMERAGHVARVGEWRAAYGVFVRKPEGKRPLGRPIPKWEDYVTSSGSSSSSNRERGLDYSGSG